MKIGRCDGAAALVGLLIISAEVRVKLACEGRGLGNSSNICEKDLPGIHWSLPRHLQAPSDALQMPHRCVFPAVFP